MKLFEHGVYLVNGNRLVEDGPEAKEQIQSLTGKTVDKKEAAKEPSPTVFWKPTIHPAIWRNFRFKFDKLIPTTLPMWVSFRRRERQGWKNSRFPMC